MNGTIRDDFIAVANAVDDVLRHFGKTRLTLQQHRELERPDYWFLYEHLGFKESDKPEVDSLFRRFFYEKYADMVSMFPDALETVKGLKYRKKIVGIVSNLSRERVIAHVNEFGLSKYIDVCVGREDTDEGKPFPQPLIEAFRRLGVPPERGSYTGDQTWDITAAHAAKTMAIGVSRRGSYHTRRMLESADPDRVIRSLSSLLYLDSR